MIVDSCLVSLPEILHTIYHETTFQMSPLILHADDLVLLLCTLYMLPSEFIFEKKIYYMSEMSAFKNFIMIEDEKVVQYLRSTFYYLLFRTTKMQLEKKNFFLSFWWDETTKTTNGLSCKIITETNWLKNWDWTETTNFNYWDER